MRKPDASAVCNITYAARVFVGMLDNHGPIDLNEAAKILREESNNFELSGFQRQRYAELAKITKAVTK